MNSAGQLPRSRWREMRGLAVDAAGPDGLGMMTAETAIKKIREVHEEFFGDERRQISRDEMCAYIARVWAVLDFTEKPKAQAVTTR